MMVMMMMMNDEEKCVAGDARYEGKLARRQIDGKIFSSEKALSCYIFSKGVSQKKKKKKKALVVARGG